jgi:hypothetical protein
MSDAELLRAHAERIRASGVLGRSSLMQRLFDFLLERSLTDRAPKEIEVAMDAFGKGADFDVSQDATVRVYVHKLRKKLEEFYAAGAGAKEPTHISIPKGEYRLVVETANARVPEVVAPGASIPATPGASIPAVPVTSIPVAPGASIANGPAPGDLQQPVSAAPVSARRKWLFVALAVSLLINVAALFTAYLRPFEARDELTSVRQSAIWSPILNADRTIFLVVGDYYIFGETDDSMEVRRLVREFAINSPQDLEQYRKLHPEQAERYLDLELAYLPTAAAYALRDLMPVLSSANRRVRVVTMSQLNPAVLKSADVIYVGYLSGLGRLGELVFRNSRLSFGESYDEIVDRKTGTRYVSQAGAPYRDQNQIRDYGYFATFAGPEGNRIVVIAGTRDVAAMHMSETLTHPRMLDALLSQAQGQPGFEALYEVYGMNRLNLDGKLLFTAPLDSARIWTGSPPSDR